MSHCAYCKIVVWVIRVRIWAQALTTMYMYLQKYVVRCVQSQLGLHP